ncbi:MAG: hypothetical protein AAFV88_16590 [Planctomycetota bacterium]
MQQQRETNEESVPTLFQLPDCTPERRETVPSDTITGAKSIAEFSSSDTTEPDQVLGANSMADFSAAKESAAAKSLPPQAPVFPADSSATTWAAGPESPRSGTPETTPTGNSGSGSNAAIDVASGVYLHEPHPGPPANHVGRPPGTHGSVRPWGPQPQAPHVAIPAAATPEQRADTNDAQPRVAEFNDEAQPDWADSAQATWITRATIGVGMMFLLTVAYYSGRGYQRIREANEPKLVDDANVSPGDDVIVMVNPDDFESAPQDQSPPMETASVDDASFQDGSAAPDSSVAMRTREDVLADIDELIGEGEMGGTAAEARPDPMSDPQAITEIVNPVIAGSANAVDTTTEPATPQDGTLGTPSTATSDLPSFDPKLPEIPEMFDDPLGVYTEETPLPNSGIPGIPDATVAYRNDFSDTPGTAPNADPTPPLLEDLPAGMDDRLDLYDGLRLSRTPYPIGNFLEILEAWEASDRF